MKKPFKDLKIGESFKRILPDESNNDKSPVYIKIRFMQNFYNTTGNKRNARLKISPSRMNNKFVYLDDSEIVEVFKE